MTSVNGIEKLRDTNRRERNDNCKQDTEKAMGQEESDSCEQDREKLTAANGTERS